MKGLRRLTAAVNLLIRFLMELLRASFRLSYLILLRKNAPIQPDLLTYPVPELGKWETLFLGQMISLTPGTLVTEIDEESKELVIHVIEASQPQEVIDGIRSRLETPLLKVSR